MEGNLIKLNLTKHKDMKKLLFFLAAIGYTVSTVAQQDKRLKGIEVELNKILSATKAAGFAVAVVEGDKVIYAKGFGYRDYENKIPVDANTLFAIGSASKAFTSAILGQLRKEDKLSFNDSPRKYIPELKFFNDNMNNNIIIKDLMCHRTGLPRHDASWYYFPTASKDSLIARLAYQEPFAGVREKWYYNNFMFLAQGVIAERITGKSWEDNIRDRFFKPLGMTRSNVSIEEMKIASNAAIGYELKKEVISKMDYYNISGMGPAGSINSSVNDMSNWLITWINKGKFKEQELIPADYIEEAMTTQMGVGGGLPDKEIPDAHFSDYGYGWFLKSYKGHYRVNHGGNIDGFSADVAFFPSDNIGIVVLANQNGSSVPGMVRNVVADYMLKVNKTDIVKKFIEETAKEKKEASEMKKKVAGEKITNTKPSHILQDYAGKYSHPGYGEFTIINQNDSLFVNLKLKKLYLKHEHYDVFDPFEVTKTGIDTTDSDGEMRFNFTTNNSGEIASVKAKMEGALDPIEFKHKPNTIKVDKDILAKYVGEYELGGMVAKVYIKNDNKLFVFVPGQPEYEMLATDKHKFSFKTLEGYKLEFVEAADKTINSLIFIQPNGKFTAKRKP